MQNTGVGLLTWPVGVLLIVPVFGLGNARFSRQRSSEGVAEHERRFVRSARTAGYRRYHANDSLIGQPVPCSHREKLCFRYNMIYNETRGCVDLKNRKATFSYGHLVLDTRKVYECDGYVMAYDDKCYHKKTVRDVICGCDAEPTAHFVHGVECRCTPSAPIHVEQPKADGRCFIPDLRFPDKDRTRFYLNPHEGNQGFVSKQADFGVSTPLPQFRCNRLQRQCFRDGLVRAASPPQTPTSRQRPRRGPARESCVPLLDKGDCADEHVVALVVREGGLETTCVHVRGGCPRGQVRMAFDGKCHGQEDVKLITNGELFQNQFGFFIVIPNNLKYLKLLPMKRGAMCAVAVEYEHSSVSFSATNVKCFSTRYEVQPEASLPEP